MSPPRLIHTSDHAQRWPTGMNENVRFIVFFTWQLQASKVYKEYRDFSYFFYFRLLPPIFTARMSIAKIHAREILDSRGNPTVEVDLFTHKGSTCFVYAQVHVTQQIHKTILLYTERRLYISLSLSAKEKVHFVFPFVTMLRLSMRMSRGHNIDQNGGINRSLCLLLSCSVLFVLDWDIQYMHTLCSTSLWYALQAKVEHSQAQRDLVCPCPQDVSALPCPVVPPQESTRLWSWEMDIKAVSWAKVRD